MIFAAVLIAAVFVVILQSRIYRKYMFDGLEYSVEVSSPEVFEDEEIYVYEEIRNNKLLPLPYLKVDTQLPDGLAFHIYEKDEKTGVRRETYPRVIHSIFVLRGKQMIRRRWRVKCDVRGTYTLGEVTVLADDVFGSSARAKVFEPTAGSRNTVVVLPKAISLEKRFTSSRYTSGDYLVNASLLTDPLLKAGARSYVPGDPTNRINWIQTAVRGELMVNVEEYTNRRQFNLIMNMQARDIEKIIPGPPSARAPVELCMTVVASILDSMANEVVPVRFICNTSPEPFGSEHSAAYTDDDEIGSKIFVSPAYRGRSDMIEALRMLAQLDLMISTPLEKMMDHILEHPHAYTGGGSVIFVSSYLSERMINFTYAMRRIGITVIYYITSSNINASIIPEDIEVHYKTYVED